MSSFVLRIPPRPAARQTSHTHGNTESVIRVTCINNVPATFSNNAEHPAPGALSYFQVETLNDPVEDLTRRTRPVKISSKRRWFMSRRMPVSTTTAVTNNAELPSAQRLAFQVETLNDPVEDLTRRARPVQNFVRAEMVCVPPKHRFLGGQPGRSSHVLRPKISIHIVGTIRMSSTTTSPSTTAYYQGRGSNEHMRRRRKPAQPQRQGLSLAAKCARTRANSQHSSNLEYTCIATRSWPARLGFFFRHGVTRCRGIMMAKQNTMRACTRDERLTFQYLTVLSMKSPMLPR